MPHKLLLADDSVTIQRVIELTFADEDIKVLAVGDGQQAVDRIESDPPDIILADVGMPKRDGYEVASYVKSHPKLAHIPVLLLTGAFEPVDQARATAAGCDGVLAKPFEPLLVISRVKELLGARAAAASRALIPIPTSQMADQATIGGHARPEAMTKSVPSTAVTELPADLSIDVMRPAVKATGPKASLDDYFDQLDAAFSKIGGSHESPASVSNQPSSPASDGDFNWLQESAVRDSKSEGVPKASDTLDFSGVTGIDSGPQDSGPRRQEIEISQPFAQPGGGRPSAHQEPIAATSLPAASTPPIADRFAALLAAEQGELPGTASTVPASPPAAPAVTSEAVVDQVAAKVLKTLSDKVVRDTVSQLVSRVAERLVREEIEKIKGGKT